MNSTLLVIINVIAFIILAIAAYILVRGVIDNNLMHTVYEQLRENESVRKYDEEQIAINEGNVEKTNFMYRLDLLLERSEIRKVLPHLTSEIFIVVLIAIMLIGTSFVYFWMDTSIILSIAIGCVFSFICYIIIFILADNNHQKVEQQIMQFLNILENYTKTSDDIINIFGKMYVHLENPLSSYIKTCYMEAMNTGDNRLAFRHLEAKVSHERFRDIIRNIEIASRHEANYDVIIDESRSIMRDYLKGRKQAKAMAANFKVELIAFSCLALVAIELVDSLMTASIYGMLFNTFLGNILLAAMAGIYLYSIYSIVTISRR